MIACQDKQTVYRLFKVPLGWCACARNRKGICAFVLPVAEAEAAEAIVLRRFPEARRSRDAMRKLIKAARNYFHGWRTNFDTFVIDISAGSDFQQRVWSITRRIPYGQVRTYRWIGMEMGRPHAARAIGSALGANPLPLIIPCHRVVCANGTLGGFSASGGIDLKVRLLELERVRMSRLGGQVRVIA